MCGDWNLVINPDLDTNNYLQINNPRARQEVLNLIEEEGFLIFIGYKKKENTLGVGEIQYGNKQD